MVNTSYVVMLRDRIEKGYLKHPTGCGGSFGELLCYEIHVNNLTFVDLSHKWGISLPDVGLLIHDHCMRMQELPHIDHSFQRN